MAQSQVDACNNALLRIGAKSITSLGDNSPEARSCSVVYDAVRRTHLRRFPWSFARTRQVLAPDVTAPAFDYTYAFTMPAECLRVLRPRDNLCDWRIEGRKILTNDSNVLNLTYVQDVTDEAQWDPAFYESFQVALALALADRITNSNVKKGDLREELRGLIAEARRASSIENGPEDAPEDDWITARV